MTSVRETYATLEKTGLTETEYDGLAWFVDEVDAGRVVDVDEDAWVIRHVSAHWRDPHHPTPNHFMMDLAFAELNCGTAGCIWGYVSSIFDIGDFTACSDAARKIFLPTQDILYSAKVSDAREATVRALCAQEPWPRHEFA